MLARVYQASTNPESLGNRLLTLLPHLWFKVILWDEVSSVNRHLSFFKKFLSYIYKKNSALSLVPSKTKEKRHIFCCAVLGLSDGCNRGGRS